MVRRCSLDASTSRPARSTKHALVPHHGAGLWTESVTSLCSDTAGFAKLALREDGEDTALTLTLTPTLTVTLTLALTVLVARFWIGRALGAA